MNDTRTFILKALTPYAKIEPQNKDELTLSSS